MRTSRITLLAAAAMLLAACNKADMVAENGSTDGKLKKMTFTADVPQDAPLTRTQLVEGNAVHWTEGDKIAVWEEMTREGWSVEKKEFSSVNISGNCATFTGEAEEANKYYAFYPYRLAGIHKFTFGIPYLYFDLPAEQTAVAGTFASDLAPSWAETVEGSNTLVFKNLCVLVKFTVGEDMAGDGTFTLVGADYEDVIAGTGFSFNIKYNSVGKPSSGGTNSITLSGTFEAGQSYYIVIGPCELKKGFSLLYENSEGKLYRKAASRRVTFTSGRILNLGTLETSGFEKAMWENLYKSMPGADESRRANTDRTITLTESDLANMASITELNLSGKSLSSLGGIAYCTNLQKLDCSNNKLKKLDVSGLTGLTELNCSNNRDLVELNFGGMTEPARPDGDTGRTFRTLRAGSGSSLQILNCSNTGIRKLDLSGLTGLTRLNCYDMGLKELDLNGMTGLTELICGHNDFTTLTISGLPKLKKIDCTNSIGLSELNFSELPALQELYCSSTDVTALDVSGLTGLRILYCAQNYMQRTLNIKGLSNLEELVCGASKLTSLDLTGVTKLKKIDCMSNNIPALDITGQSQLENLLCGEQTVDDDKGVGDPLFLRLTLTPAQKTKWDSIWVNEKWGNSNVILNVIN